jgi:DNA polymerase-4
MIDSVSGRTRPEPGRQDGSPGILTTRHEIDLWMTAPAEDALRGRPRGLTVMLPYDTAPERLATIEQHAPDSRVEPARQRKIIHIDMDAFYASVEQRDYPELRGRPVAVGGSRERGVVAAASYEARKFGVRSAMPSITAKRQCPDLIFVKPRFEAYKAVSLQIREIFAEHTAVIEPLSLDEAYLDVTENLQGIATATEIAEQIRAKIRAETGLTASAGVSYNKFLAKLASDHRKPDGLFVITPKGLPLSRICQSANSMASGRRRRRR